MCCERWLAIAIALVVAACRDQVCNRQSDCATGYECAAEGVCRSTTPDAGDGDAGDGDAGDGDAGDGDADVDAPIDAAIDAPVDAAIDAPVDAATDAPVDAAIDAPVDAAVDAPSPPWLPPQDPFPGEVE
jgi:hypothetical protein